MRWILRFMLFGLVSCAGFEKACSSSCATSIGADWVVVQYTMDGTPLRCWALDGVSVSSETNSDGIYWLSKDGNLVHLSGQYNMVQVEGNRWREAYDELGLTEETCESIHNRHFVPGSGWAFSNDSNN